MFILKKWLSSLLMPMPLVMIFLTAGIILLLLTRRGIAKGLLALSWGMLLLIFISPLPHWLVMQLEAPYSQHQPDGTAYEFIVVLGGGHNSDPRQPLGSRLKSFSLARISEGIRLARLYPEARLVLSGYPGNETQSNAAVMRAFALEMGIAAGRIQLYETPRDTTEEASQIAPLIRHDPALLVTSAFHMQRALKLFAWQNCRPTAAPTHFLSIAAGSEPDNNFFLISNSHLPSASGLIMLEYAWHEWLGIVWAELIHQYFSNQKT